MIGLRELALVAVVVLVLYGRSGVHQEPAVSNHLAVDLPGEAAGGHGRRIARRVTVTSGRCDRANPLSRIVSARWQSAFLGADHPGSDCRGRLGGDPSHDRRREPARRPRS